ncbi:MAG: hypothetical protein WA989_00375 [Henriciella sp.]|uniref:hypothetical protein n=1 Tax=Henriciella sp. TaxID=1968823 RepID=UPI003C74E2D7
MRETVRTILIAWFVALSGMSSAIAQGDSSVLGPDAPVVVEQDPVDRVLNRGNEPRGQLDRERVEQLVERHVENERLQTERAEWEPEPMEIEPRQRNSFLDAIADFFAWFFRTFGGLFKLLMFGVIAAAIIYALWYMFGDIVGIRFGRKKAEAGPDTSEIDDQRPDQKQAVALLEQADALAAEGKFAEAVHLLLFRSIEDLREKRAGGVPQSLTAREIQSLSDLPQKARQALAPIIRIVETSFFGGRSVDRDGWQSARKSYEDFAFGGAAA